MVCPVSFSYMAEIDLPVLRNEGTVEENLNDNAINNILPARYTNPGEDATEVFERVAKNIAVAELVWIDDPVMLKPKHIKPDHPRRDQLIEEVFGTSDLEPDAEVTVRISEDNARYVSFDSIIDDLNSDEAQNPITHKNRFRDLMENLSFMPNSPTLMNAGGELQQLSACFVDSPEDDIDNIHDTAREAAKVFQSGGGMGYGFWTLRPKGSSVGSTGGIASGPITFMRTYDQMCETIAQGGTRRGAQMGVMKIDHPDVIEFIHAKRKDVSLANTLRLNDPDDFTHNSFAEALDEARDIIDENGRVPEHLRNAVEGHLSNFNISVGVTDEFMEAVENGTLFVMRDPQSGEPFEANPETKEMYELFGMGGYITVGEEVKIPARELWDHIIEGAHENGEPGVVFIERFNKEHSFPVNTDEPLQNQEYAMLATNPCGEQPLMEYEACNLGHINLSTIVDRDAVPFSEFDGDIDGFLQHSIDWQEFDYRIDVGTRFLDNVVTMSDFPVEEIEETVANNRKVGLGVMGLAQMFIQLGVEYGSDEANEIARQIMKHINHRSKKASSDLSMDRTPFGNWEDSKYADPTSYPDWFEKQTGLNPENWEEGYPIRNHNTTTIAPTGTTSMIADTSGGCEPIYSVGNFKNVSDDIQGDEMLQQFDSLFLQVLRENDIDVESVKDEIVTKMEANEFGGVDSLDTVPQEIADLFVTTSDLTALEHAGVQCAMQEGVDSAISKTVNAPNDADIDDTRQAFEFVYKNGGKGVTYYRDGTRSKQVLTTRSDNQSTGDSDVDVEAVTEEYLQDEYGVSLDDVSDVANSSQIGRQSGSDGSPGHTPRSRPDTLVGKTYRVSTGYGNMYVIVNDLDGEPFEVIATIGKSGGRQESMIEGLARMVSSSLRAGMDVDSIIQQLRGIRSPKVGWDNGRQIQSIPDGIAKVLIEHTGNDPALRQSEEVPKNVLAEEESVGNEDSDPTSKNLIVDGGGGNDVLCPSCPDEGMVVMSEGCKTCERCGWSEC